MPVHPQLQRFVDDELMRAPLLFDQVLQATADSVRRQLPQDRTFQQALLGQQVELTREFIASLRSQVQADLAQPARRAAPAPGGLSLVDDDAVRTDVELSRAIEAIASTAEHELRELGAFTSALVGDVHVARDTNPFRPEVYARALWASAHALQLPHDHQLAFLRHAAPLMAQSLRKAYAAACTRLEDAGVQPGTYSTIVLPGGTRTAHPAEPEPEPLAEMRESMPVPLDEPAPGALPLHEALLHVDELLRTLPADAGTDTRAQALDSQRMRLLGSAATRADQQLIELLSRLFDAILADRAIAPQVLVLLSRLHSAALRCALHEPAALDSYEHPLWQFVDRIAFVDEVHGLDGDPLRDKMLGYVGGLIDNMVREPVQDAKLFRWGLERLLALEKHLFQQRLDGAAAHIGSLRVLAHKPPDTGHAPLDVGALHTVPAELMSLGGDTVRDEQPLDALDALLPGHWVRAFHAGRWRAAQLLWRDEPHQVWLFADAFDGSRWALERAALERLHGARLIDPLAPPSLVRRAADTVLRNVPRG